MVGVVPLPGALDIKIDARLFGEMGDKIQPPDAAGCAARAYAIDLVSSAIDVERMRDYWTWWLTSAVPQAAQRALPEQQDDVV